MTDNEIQTQLLDVFRQAHQLLQAGRFEEVDPALAFLDELTVTNPGLADAFFYYNLGVLYRLRGGREKAVQYFAAADRMQPHNSEMIMALGNALRDMGRMEQAIVQYRKVVKTEPLHVAAWSNLGYLLARGGKLKAALECYDTALAIEPDNVFVRRNRYHALFRLGRWREGFQEAECRLLLPEYRPLFSWVEAIPRWRGEEFSGKHLLVHHEQGFGDSIQFVRYLPLLQDYCGGSGTVILSVPAPLLRLFGSVPGADELIEHTPEAIAAAQADFRVSVMSLPALLAPQEGGEDFCLSARIPYLQAQLMQDLPSAQRLCREQLNIGLVWAASNDHRGEQLEGRSCGLKALAPLAGIPGAAFFSLQKGEASAEAARPPEGMALSDLSEELRDFADTAAWMAKLDLVITVDTAAAHLAGALGCPVWVLLPFDQNWRWISGRSDTPWYPDMRLFQQSHPGDWHAPVGKIVKELRRLIKKKEAEK